MPDWVSTIAEAILPGIIVGIVMAYWNRRQHKSAAVQDEREANAKRKEALEISLLVATAELSYAIAMAIERGSPNGEVEAAKKRYAKAMEKFREFEREQLYSID